MPARGVLVDAFNRSVTVTRMHSLQSVPHFVVDAFTASRFRGNPAAVVVLDKWLDDDALKKIAAENNLSETAFLVREPDAWRIRWMTPTVEVDLCGHATLAAAHVVLSKIEREIDAAKFDSKSGRLVVVKESDGRLAMDFPARPAKKVPLDNMLSFALGAEAKEAWKGRDLVVIFDTAEEVRNLDPDFRILAQLGLGAVNPTALGTGDDADVDFVSRFFAPNEGVNEDPVTGSAHCTLGPLWGERLGKTTLRARQVSARGGELEVELRGDRVTLRGHATLVVEGKMSL
jgi:PhzF family phenazine biosynthesis protein